MPARCASTNGTLCAAFRGSGRRLTGRWSRGTPTSQRDRGRSKPTTPRSERATTWPRACARPLPGEAPALRQLGPLGSWRPPVGQEGPIFPAPALGLDLATHGRGRPPRASAMTGREWPATSPRAILLQFLEGVPQFRAFPRSRSPAADTGDELAQRRVVSSRYLPMRFTGTPACCISQIVGLSSSENRFIHTPPDRRHHCSPIRLGVAMTS